MTKPHRRTEIKVINREDGKVKRIIRTDKKLSSQDIRQVGSAVNLARKAGIPEEKVQDIAKEAEKTAVLKNLDAPKSMLNHRIRQLKRQGMSNVRIAAILDIHESTVRRRLKMPMTDIEILLDKMLYDLEDCREDILGHLVDTPEFAKVFGEGFGEQFVLRVHTNARKVEINPRLKRVKFSLEFVATVKDAE